MCLQLALSLKKADCKVKEQSNKTALCVRARARVCARARFLLIVDNILHSDEEWT